MRHGRSAWQGLAGHETHTHMHGWMNMGTHLREANRRCGRWYCCAASAQRARLLLGAIGCGLGARLSVEPINQPIQNFLEDLGWLTSPPFHVRIRTYMYVRTHPLKGPDERARAQHHHHRRDEEPPWPRPGAAASHVPLLFPLAWMKHAAAAPRIERRRPRCSSACCARFPRWKEWGQCISRQGGLQRQSIDAGLPGLMASIDPSIDRPGAS